MLHRIHIQVQPIGNLELLIDRAQMVAQVCSVMNSRSASALFDAPLPRTTVWVIFVSLQVSAAASQPQG